ncbi:MAG: ATP-binding cassette domain-containing protein [Candidatus Eisenbacteria sp.]|nr:ATP-binding cassette domain-containing protein [Candidatus Eisenbacteria bacterium]
MLQATSLDYRYSAAEEQTALSGIDFAANAGQWVAVMGANGSGKSTLLQLLAGIRVPSRGRVLIDGVDMRDLACRREIARHVGIVFQDPATQLVSATVEREVAFGLEHMGMPAGEMRSRVKQLLEYFDITSVRNRPPQSLSGGQKQRVVLASVLAMEPGVLLLDEPTALLDSAAREKLMGILENFRAGGAMAIVMATAHPEEVLRADRVAVLSRGCLVADEAPRSLFSREQECEKWGLPRPPAARMASALGRRGRTLPDSPMTVAEFVSAWTAASADASPKEGPRE